MYSFPCGCLFNTLNNNIKSYDNLPSIEIPYEQIVRDLNYNKYCNKTWKIFSEGNTIGVFQLDKRLGQEWSEKLKPTSLDEIAALISIIRPGVLLAEMDNMSMAEHYVNRKHGVSVSTPPYPCLTDLLDDTYYIMLYQEQSMKIASYIAGFNEQEADVLRKAIGHKDIDLMKKVEKNFLEACKNFGIPRGLCTEEESLAIFDWIRESQKYSFNKSHAIEYGAIGYLTAYVKQHFPLHFYCAWLSAARNEQKPQEKVRELISDSKKSNIDVLLPNIKSFCINNADMHIDNDKIRFGIRCIKRMGEKHIESIKEKVSKEDISTWYSFLTKIVPECHSDTLNGLITGGVLDEYNIPRNRMLYEADKVRQLTKKQISLLRESDKTNLVDALIDIQPKVMKSQTNKIGDLIRLLLSPTSSLEDKIPWIIKQEKDLYGVSITYDPIDQIKNKHLANTSCKDALQTKGKMILCGEIEDFYVFNIKTGKNIGKPMCRLKLNDGISVEITVFHDLYMDVKDILYTNNFITVEAEMNKGLIARNIQELF